MTQKPNVSKEERQLTRGQAVAADVAALLRARNPLLWIVSREEARVEAALIEAAASAGYITRTWDVAQGSADMLGIPVPIGDQDPGVMLAAIRQRAQDGIQERCVWIMRDLPIWLTGPIGATVNRSLRNLARLLPGIPRVSAQAIVVLTPSLEVPPELADHATVIEWPLPDRAEIATVLDAALEAGGDKIQQPANGAYEAALDAAVGLSHEEAAACYAKSLVQWRKIDVATVAKEKKRVIARERVLTWEDNLLSNGLDAVGGLEGLKQWLVTHASAYSARARAYGLPSPKGALLVGIPGCGKTMTARAIAAAYNVPLLRLDMGALRDKYVGASEQNLRKALSVIESVGRCVVLLDEVEKALAGGTQGAADGGVSADALGTILSWMSDRTGQAFIVATCNDISSLPPEFMRAGRFDCIWFCDLPNETERKAILTATLCKHGRSQVKINTVKIADACKDFTGSEIAEIVPDAMFTAFNDGEREITDADLLSSAAKVIPLSLTAAEKITKLREWAKTRARPASLADGAFAQQQPRVKVLDI